jgi:PKD repeat protein
MRNKLQLGLFLTLLIIGAQGISETVKAAPAVDFFYSGICVGSPTTFTVNNTITNSGTVHSWDWDFGDGIFSTLKDPLHTYAGPGNYTVTLTITDINGDVGTVSKIIAIQKLPRPILSYTPLSCGNEPVQFVDLTDPVHGYIMHWEWDYGDGSPVETINFNADPNPKHTFPNKGTFEVKLKVINTDLCENQASFEVNIPTSPIADFKSFGKCEDQEVAFIDASSANGGLSIVALSWDFGDPTSGIQNESDETNPKHTYSNPGTYTVSLIVRNFDGCTDTVSKQVVVNPSPSVDIIPVNNCLNSLTAFAPDPAVTNMPAVVEWLWDFGDSQTSNIENPLHAYTAPGNYNVTLKITDTLGCWNEAEFPVEVEPLPDAHFNVTLANCAGNAVQFQNENQPPTAVSYIVQWNWNFGDGDSIQINNLANPAVSHVYSLAGTYQSKLTVTASNGCSNSDFQQISILPNPNADFTFTSACLGEAFSFTDITLHNGAGANIKWEWNFDDAGSGVFNKSGNPNPEHIFSTSGNHSVQLIITSGNGCTDTVSHTVFVNALPSVNFTATSNCQNNSVDFLPDAAVMNFATVSTWFWDFGNGMTSPFQNPSVIYTTPGTFYATLTVSDNTGCTNSLTKLITIIPQPKPNFSFVSPACNYSSVQFNNISETPAGTIIRSEWDFGDGNVQTVPARGSVSHKYMSANTFNVTLTVITDDSCRKSITMPVVILPDPTADFSFLTTCINSAVQFSDLSKPGSGSIASWSWNFGDAPSGINNTSTLKNPNHTYSVSGTYQVRLIITNNGGCIDTVVKSIVINGLPFVDFSYVPGCMNDQTQFVSSTFVNSGLTVSRIWNFGDGFTSTETDPLHTYNSTGPFTVSLTINDVNGCTNTISHSVNIITPPVSLFQVSPQTCKNNSVIFNNSSYCAAGTITSYYWEFGDGSDTLILAPANANVSHTYAGGSNFIASLTVVSSLGCSSKTQHIIQVSASPVAQFNFNNTCEGASVNFNDVSHTNSGTSIVSWLWNFGDLSSGPDNNSVVQNPIHVYSSPGSYSVNLIAVNASGCTDTTTRTVVIKQKPALDFSWVASCLGNSTVFSPNTMVINVADVTEYDWDFGDGTAHNTAQMYPSHNYAYTGDFNVSLTITNTSGCKNKISHLVSVLPKPTASFSLLNSCEGVSTQFTDQSYTTGGSPITNRLWDFGVGSANNDTSALKNPEWTYSNKGIYYVKLTVSTQNGCQDVATRSLQVFGKPTANFSYSASPCENGAVHFQNMSSSQQATIVASNWEFESNSFSTLHNPLYVYYANDTCYDVILIVKDSRGCIDTIQKPVCVPADYDFTFAISNTCLKDSTYFTPQILAPSSGSLVSFKWNFGDITSGASNTSALRLPSHYYSQPGTYTISLEATDVNNCSKIVYKDVTVLPLPMAAFSYTKGICDSTIYFKESSSGNGSPINRWIWNFGDGEIMTIYPPNTPDIAHLYVSPGEYEVSLTVYNDNGCSHTARETTIKVMPCLDAAFELVDNQVCQNTPAAFSNSSYSSVTSNIWYWDFGDGTRTVLDTYTSQVMHTYKNPGAYTVQMVLSTLVSGKKVTDTAHAIINVNPAPTPDFSYSVVCNEQKAIFTNLSSGSGTRIIDYKWTFGDPGSANENTSTTRDPVHKFTARGTYEITLLAENIIGCKESIQKAIVISGIPDANFKSSISCAGNKTVFSDLSSKAGAPIMGWKWTFSDGFGIIGGSEAQDPEFIFNKSGDYLVDLKITDGNGCHDSISQYVSTWEVPKSDFTYTENFGDVQGQLQFNNNSVDATQYNWNFGDGNVSYAPNPVELYNNEGSYDITLIAVNNKGCSDTLSLKYDFMVKGLFVPTAFSPLNPKAEVQLLKPVGINLQEYRFEVYDRWGTLLWWTDKLDADGCPIEGWDGKFKEMLLPEGAYMWKAWGIFKDGSIWEAENIGNSTHLPKSKSGTSTMIR